MCALRNIIKRSAIRKYCGIAVIKCNFHFGDTAAFRWLRDLVFLLEFTTKARVDYKLLYYDPNDNNLIRSGDRIRLDKDCSLFNCPFAATVADGNLFAGTTDIHTYTRNRTHQSYYAIAAAAGLKIRVVAN